MIADTTFLSHYFGERSRSVVGPARSFFHAHRAGRIRTSVICLGEIAVFFPTSIEAWSYFDSWTIYRLHRGIVDAAADVDREMIHAGRRLGENDNWIAGFARYYREPLISRDTAFDRVRGVRRIAY